MPQTHEAPTFVGISRAAEILGISSRTMRRWIDEGKVQGYRLADHGIRVNQADVMKLIVPMSHASGVS
ncbi:helix-turn-helix domain-containing protein [Nocardia fluminea]|uniref:helix-turn-helix domain-containing protein n=1 Tax=Nocardia fluminea TaxID=134984 RepID=UPI00365F4D4A